MLPERLPSYNTWERDHDVHYTCFQHFIHPSPWELVSLIVVSDSGVDDGYRGSVGLHVRAQTLRHSPARSRFILVIYYQAGPT